MECRCRQRRQGVEAPMTAAFGGREVSRGDEVGFGGLARLREEEGWGGAVSQGRVWFYCSQRRRPVEETCETNARRDFSSTQQCPRTEPARKTHQDARFSTTLHFSRRRRTSRDGRGATQRQFEEGLRSGVGVGAGDLGHGSRREEIRVQEIGRRGGDERKIPGNPAEKGTQKRDTVRLVP
ncbi:hypothetical protein BHM03_00051659 [Ensete ventricosum]|nr:hypothetical protein BHM03_00051659 [Ensete ventricosum]